MDPNDTFFDKRLACPAPTHNRYDYLKTLTPWRQRVRKVLPKPKPKYFFALDLYNSAALLPRLLGSIVETIRFLGPDICVLSITEGRSTDGTAEVLALLKYEIERLGVQYVLQHSNINPMDGSESRFKQLADLRNLALLPLLEAPENFSEDTTVLFINDVSLCMEDILELIHQRKQQGADMVCAMDYINPDKVIRQALFYDVYISRQINGDTFFYIPSNVSWQFSFDLFWNDDVTKNRFEKGLPFQVWSCWNGVTAFTAAPLMSGKMKFRDTLPYECILGEPTLFCKDLWFHGFGKIAVVPSVAVGYDDEKTTEIKEYKGRVGEWLERQGKEGGKGGLEERISWKGPPEKVNCAPEWTNQKWVPWDEALRENGIVP
ncbi:family 69 glycosyltransferase [Delitschia confertaspora ATCC 74209]|uniref:Family 69 glycosyltransferase n=1 Tax=Delitschia confertaspora ATCC 74209 TaxID=1513339 RepID=A0A9P4MTQ2_9PLEO|nr:family 69 glycosyltransferase [Delitschia confertaspora ATCC 74209]